MVKSKLQGSLTSIGEGSQKKRANAFLSLVRGGEGNSTGGKAAGNAICTPTHTFVPAVKSMEYLPMTNPLQAVRSDPLVVATICCTDREREEGKMIGALREKAQLRSCACHALKKGKLCRVRIY